MQTKANLILILLLLGFCCCITAQNRRVVVDREHKPLIGATIQIVQLKDSSIAATRQSDSSGRYIIDSLSPDLYFLRFSYTGMQTQSVALRYLPDTLILSATENVLREFVVRSSKPLLQQQSFGTSINVEKSILSKGNSVLDVLERSPGVAVDHRNMAISLNGNTGVMVMLNGQVLRLPAAQVMGMLASLPADDVARIDLMHIAPAGFDAEGTAGIIRIITRQSKTGGTNGSVSVTGGIGWGPKAGTTAQITHNTGKWQLSGSYTYGLDRNYSDLWIDSHQVMPLFGGQMSVLVKDTSKATQQNHTAIVSAYYTPDSTVTIGIQTVAGKSKVSLAIHDRSDYFLSHDSTLYFGSSLNSINRWDNASVSVFFDKRLKNRQSFSVRGDYLHYSNDNPTNVLSSITNDQGKPVGQGDTAWAPQQRGYAQTGIDVLTEKIDYTKSVTSHLQFQTGIKTTQTLSTSLSGIESFVNGQWIARAGTLAQGSMREYITAAYANIDLAKNKWKAGIGGRYEYAKTRIIDPGTGAQQADRKLGKFFPVVFISYQPAPAKQWQVSYTERISRPTYNDLASFVRYSDATAVYTGNPLLLPGISRQAKLGVTLRDHSFLISYARNSDLIAGYQLTESPDRKLLYVGPQNVQLSETVQLQWNLNMRFKSWWAFNSTIAGSWNQFHLNYTPVPLTHAYFRYNVSLTQNFSLVKGYAAEISGWFNSASFNGSTLGSAVGSVSAGIKKDFSKSNSRVQLTVSDILRTEQYGHRYGTIGTEAFQITNHVLYNAESRRFPIIKLSYVKSFGAATAVKRRSKETAEESERIRTGQ